MNNWYISKIVMKQENSFTMYQTLIGGPYALKEATERATELARRKKNNETFVLLEMIKAARE